MPDCSRSAGRRRSTPPWARGESHPMLLPVDGPVATTGAVLALHLGAGDDLLTIGGGARRSASRFGVVLTTMANVGKRAERLGAPQLSSKRWSRSQPNRERHSGRHSTDAPNGRWRECPSGDRRLAAHAGEAKAGRRPACRRCPLRARRLPSRCTLRSPRVARARPATFAKWFVPSLLSARLRIPVLPSTQDRRGDGLTPKRPSGLRSGVLPAARNSGPLLARRCWLYPGGKRSEPRADGAERGADQKPDPPLAAIYELDGPA